MSILRFKSSGGGTGGPAANSRSRRLRATVSAIAAMMAVNQQASAQWLTQTITVGKGWTAAYLFVDASSQRILPASPGFPIAPGNPIDKVWLWKAPSSAAQYVIDPATPLSLGGPWVSWGLTNTQNTLSTLIPNAAYLIHSTASTNFTWKIQGQPVPPHYSWDITGLNLIGFSTPANNPPDFQDFLAQDPAVAAVAQIYQYVGGEFSSQPPLNPAPVVSRFYTPVTRGEAFWVSALNVNNTYFGPFQINLPDPNGLSFGTSGGQITFHLVNVTPNPLTVSMSLLPSETPPYGQASIVAPPPLLLEGALNASNLTYAYTVVAPKGGASSWVLPPFGQPGSDVQVVLGVNRFAMGSPRGSLYAGILQFTDSLGFSQVNIPVSASAADNTGLWAGKASVTQVSYDLKSYARNSDGSFVINSTTNFLVTTNPFTLGTTSNLLINDAVSTTLVTNYFTTTNQVINTYFNITAQETTNSYVISSNLNVNYTFTTNIEIDTAVTGYHFTNNSQLLVWETSNTTNAPEIISQITTNLVLVTNEIATVPDGTPVTITNFEYDNYEISSVLVTNGPFEAPMTNTDFTTNYTVALPSSSVAVSHNSVGTSYQTNATSVAAAPTLTNYMTSAEIVDPALSTNYFPVSSPLFVFTNGQNLVSINVATNISEITNILFLYYSTNSLVVSNDYTVFGGVTNLVSATTNEISAEIYNAPFALSFTNATNLTLLYATNPLAVFVTNQLIASVSNYVVAAHNTNLDAVAAPYPLRLIVFNDGNGNCSLLQRVYYGIQQGTNVAVSTTEAALDPSQLGSARRITATHLPWAADNTPWGLSGGPLAQGATLVSSPIIEQYDDQASNPFLHTYHPDHNNLDTESPPHELARGYESYTIERTITLSLGAATNDFLSLTAANSSLSGAYSESITMLGIGSAAKTYQTAGSFSLVRISPISVLTTQ